MVLANLPGQRLNWRTQIGRLTLLWIAQPDAAYARVHAA
jgi:hypothetical protein